MRRFYNPFIKDSVEVFSFSREETRHLQRVLRLNVGDEILVFDGVGNEYKSEIHEFKDKHAVAKIINKVEPKATESPLNLTLGVALIKGDKFDFAIQKAVELGVSKLIPLITVRSDVKTKNTEKKFERRKKIIVEASKQCERATLMKTSTPVSFKHFAEKAKDTKIMFSERGGNSFSEINTGKNITAIIGPEGGWDNSEIKFALEKDFQVITLGKRIMRAETAVLSVAAILQNQFGDLN